MIYEARLTIPKNTVQASPATTTFEVSPGVLKRVEVWFPPGPSGLAHVQIRYWERQLFPSNPNSDFIGDDLHLEFDEDLEITDPPYGFTILGWNEDDTYPHTVTVRMQILPFDKDILTALNRIGFVPVSPPIANGD